MTDDPSDDLPEEREITAPCPDCGGGGVILTGPIWIFQTSQTCPKCHGMGFIVKPVRDVP